MENIYLPEELKKLLENKNFTLDQMGLSGAKVLIFEDSVLKISSSPDEMRKEAELLSWLEGRLPAPKLLLFGEENAEGYLLMSRIEGEMACSESLMSSPQKLISSLADAIRLLWTVDISSCPVLSGLDQKLAAARKTVELGLADTENCAPGTYGKGGFATPEALLMWLENNRPEEDPVFSHGDLCLPNIMFNEGKLSGFIDLGRGGVADRWNDIAICHRSLTDNYVGRYSRKTYEGFDPEMLLSALEIPRDKEKLIYYKLLDELA